jgi:hypothetical protein
MKIKNKKSFKLSRFEITTVGVIICLIRIYLTFVGVDDTQMIIKVYKDIAHLFVGGCGFAAAITKDEYWKKMFWYMSGLELT